MRNDITSLLQPHAAPHTTPGKVHNVSKARSVEQPPSMTSVDRVTISNQARALEGAESKLAAKAVRPAAPPAHAVENVSARQGSGGDSHGASSQSIVTASAQKPSPAMANMLEAFFTTSDMNGFSQSSDLNADGVINFLDLAALRDIETGVDMPPVDEPAVTVKQMTEAFLTTKGSEGYDSSSDLNDDGIINFHDLAMLRATLEDG